MQKYLLNFCGAGTQALIYVLDAADRARVGEAREELCRIINDREMRDAIILVFANKQDLPHGLSIFNIVYIREK